MAYRGLISFWWLPCLAAVVWLSMLLGMLLSWAVSDHGEVYDYLDPDIKIVYISHVGAGRMKPLFIAGSLLSCLLLDLAMLTERYLRHKRRLLPDATVYEKLLATLSIFFAIVGSIGLVGLAIFDTKNYHILHNLLLAHFLGGYMLAAVCACWECHLLIKRNSESWHR
ncbi:FK506 suppressor Sfk1 [Cordyceps fumosorosea ARSEF 2679]|uniref:FK506 suppressor Sfk1 n=1 Tax=Cordyceps fumosorosea (strain ARSEF 2679) TaxID=1081104 RepID=A0A167YF78_CORFA|nr:FK506 suppressor Sfk1 [Cordyceps fumosorosea ARSEF 2679]OAA66256.1 FK506 suppressor Sfk1 [Cordyceps fumosorosea ARSEF 2679]